jgi:hypothetical protein
MPLVNLTHDGEAGSSSAVKDEPANEPIDEPDERGKQNVIDDNMYKFHQYYDPSAASTTRLVLGLNFIEFRANPCNI